MNSKTTIFWFRRDLRLKDNAGLYHALKSGKNIIPLFIFDSTILNQLEDKKDPRVQFLHHEIEELKKELEQLESDLLVKFGKPLEIFKELIANHQIGEIYCNHDYEPNAIKRDLEIKDWSDFNNIKFCTFKDQCIFEKDEICKDDGKPYTIFTT